MPADREPPPYTPTGTAHTPSETARTPSCGSTPPSIMSDDALPPPAYDSPYGTVNIHESALDTSARLADDGRVNITINSKSRRFSTLLAQAKALRSQPAPTPQVPPEFVGVPKLNIVIQLIGSRGDIQPFLALAKELHDVHGHRIRVATHPVFKSFVEDVPGIEFFSIGGDPSELMAFMVKNPGLIPGTESLKNGEVTKRRRAMLEVMEGAWRSCVESGFSADAIIANPPSFAHVHCAERLGVPVHLMFTMPWSPTAAFPHPLANIQSSNAELSVTNYLSYALVDMLTWQGLGDLVNKFRERTLGLQALTTMWAPGLISRLKIPHTYAWSPALIPKPDDWTPELNISGFFFLSLADRYTPPADLARFLDGGPPPVYIGFGSIVVDDPNALTTTILSAIRTSGCRALLAKGWGGIGAGDLQLPPAVHLIDNCPHDWLFARCAAVVHHGGAGTTAAAIRAGKPSIIVPFFGDQPFWGAMVHRAGAGPEPIHNKSLTAANLAAAITTALTPAVQAKAETLGGRIRAENGARAGAESFHQSLTLTRCAILASQPASWRTAAGTPLSALAAELLVGRGLLAHADLAPHRHTEYRTATPPTDPITGGAGALIGTLAGIGHGVGDFPRELFRSFSDPSNPNTQTDVLRALPAAGSSLRQIVASGLSSPADFTRSLAAGFRNAPRLYGDTDVRPPPEVRGVQSGLRAAGRELGLGLFDGITGLVRQPVEGARKGGAGGLVTGFGKGVAGLALKGGAAFWGVPAYALEGVQKEFLKTGMKASGEKILMARRRRGEREAAEVGAEVVERVVEGWERVQRGEVAAVAEDPEMEEAIRRSVAETSRGDAREDQDVEAAIRASLAEMQRMERGEEGDAELREAIQHSVREHRPAGNGDGEALARALRETHLPRVGEGYDEDAALERALRESRSEEDREAQDMLRAVEESLRVSGHEPGGSAGGR